MLHQVSNFNVFINVYKFWYYFYKIAFTSIVKSSVHYFKRCCGISAYLVVRQSVYFVLYCIILYDFWWTKVYTEIMCMWYSTRVGWSNTRGRSLRRCHTCCVSGLVAIHLRAPLMCGWRLWACWRAPRATRSSSDTPPPSFSHSTHPDDSTARRCC